MPQRYACFQCNGAGVLWDRSPQQAGSSGARGAKGGGADGWSGVVVLLALFLAALSYFYSATIFFKFWAGHSQQNWLHFAIYGAASLALLIAVAWTFGFAAGFVFGLIMLLPVVHSIHAGTGFYWIVFRSEVSAEFTRFVRWCSFIAALVGHGLLAWQAAKAGRGFRARPGRWWVARGTVGRAAMAGLCLTLLATATSVALAVGNF